MAAVLPAKVSNRFFRLAMYGIFFEIFLAVLWPALPELSVYFPHFSWLFPLIQEALVIIHIPVLFILSLLDWSFDNLFVSLINSVLALGCLLFMAAGWAVIFGWILRLKNVLLSRATVRQKRIAKYSAALFFLVILLKTGISILLAAPRPFTSTANATAMVTANNAFALDLYQRLETEPGNLFFSPYSISSALAMTYAGARGQTEEEMARVLHFDSAQTNVHSGFQALTDRINSLQRWGCVQLVTANSLWCQQDYPFTDAFLNLIKQNYQAEARPVDFAKASGAVQNDINDWVERKTDGKIQDLVGDGQLTPLTRLVLCNAIYFKGAWKTQFDPVRTKSGPFYVSSNQTVTVPMMSVKSHFKTARSDDDLLQLVEMPYVGGDLSMIILLPMADPRWQDGNQPTLSDVEAQLTPQNLQAWLAKLDQTSGSEMYLSLPRFTTTQSFDLTEQLKSMGMPSAFDENTANFSGMDGTTNLFISKVLHKAYVAVDESGTEAAAATMVLVKLRSATPVFTVNQPFIFLIRDNASGAILFLGRIVDPTK
jgi:serpin B